MERELTSEKSWSVTIHYVVNHDTAVYLFDTEEEAGQFLADSYAATAKFYEGAGTSYSGSLVYDEGYASIVVRDENKGKRGTLEELISFYLGRVYI